MTHTAKQFLARLVVIISLTPAAVAASEISLPLSDGVRGVADFRSGMSDKPAVLVLHGFLQTHNFSTVELIRGELAGAGYAVLSPTLSLNIDNRRRSLTCDAIQSHTVEQSTAEIAVWVDWLKQQGYERVVVIGHSTGSNNLLSYLSHNPDPAVTHFIATSLGPIDQSANAPGDDKPTMPATTTTKDGKVLKKYSLGFCRDNYTTTPEFFRSYLQWNRDRVVEELQAVPVPTTVVLGEDDKWLPADWRNTLEGLNVNLRVIDEANHYFSGISEFDFQESVLQLVDQAAGANGQP